MATNIKIKVYGDPYIPDGTVLTPKYLDDEGDAKLTEEDASRYSTTWVFSNSFEWVEEEAPSDGFKVIINVKDLMELHSVLDHLPQHVVESATLETI